MPLLIIDDFAVKPLHPPYDEDFHDLIAARYERAASIVTSNFDLSEWGDAFPDNRILGAATLDRLRHGAYRVVIDGEGFRKPKPMPGSSENAVAKSGKKPHSRARSNLRFNPVSAGSITPPILGSITVPRDIWPGRSRKRWRRGRDRSRVSIPTSDMASIASHPSCVGRSKVL